jgi:hypothetical protein
MAQTNGSNQAGSYTPTTALATAAPGAPLAVAATNETSAMVLAAQAKALVEARFTIAHHKPRNLESVRQRLLNLCKDPGFSEEALYCKPMGGKRDDEEDGDERRGGGVEGLSIRFVEAALQILRNVDTSSTAIYDDHEKRIVRITVADMEENVAFSTDVTIKKTVERRSLRRGEEDLVIRQRTNSWGKPVYIRWATDEEILDKVNALTSKAIREAGKRLIPADIRAEAERTIRATLAKQDQAVSPSAARRKILDNFFAIGVDADMVAELLGHDRAEWTPKEIQRLRGTFVALREGLATWDEILEGKPEVQKKIEEVAARNPGAQAAAPAPAPAQAPAAAQAPAQGEPAAPAQPGAQPQAAQPPAAAPAKRVTFCPSCGTRADANPPHAADCDSPDAAQRRAAAAPPANQTPPPAPPAATPSAPPKSALGAEGVKAAMRAQRWDAAAPTPAAGERKAPDDTAARRAGPPTTETFDFDR